jgi:hypothetical protein
MKDLRHSLSRSGLRDPADRPQCCPTTTLDTAKKKKKRKRYDEKTAHGFSELALKPEIINSSWEFVADFCVSEKKKLLTGTLRKNGFFHRSEQFRFAAPEIPPFA